MHGYYGELVPPLEHEHFEPTAMEVVFQWGGWALKIFSKSTKKITTPKHNKHFLEKNMNNLKKTPTMELRKHDF